MADPYVPSETVTATATSTVGDRAPAPASTTEPSLMKRTAVGSAWTILSQIGQHGLRIVNSVILATILHPQDFGLMTLVWLIMQGLAMLSDVGIGPMIVRSPRGNDPAFLNTAWTFAIIRGILLSGFALALAWPLAWLYEKPDLAGPIAITGISATISGLMAVSVYTVDRDLRQATSAILELVPQVVALVVTVAWAWLNPTVWALVGGALVGLVVKMAMSYFVTGHRHHLTIEPQASREILGTGKWVFLSSILGFFGSSMDRLILGKLLTTGALGIYGVAYNLAGIPSAIFVMLGWKVLFPALAAKGRDGEISSSVDRAKSLLTYIGGTVTLGMLLAGPALIDIMYPPKFHDAGWKLEIIVLGVWFQILDVMAYSAVLAKGHLRWLGAAMSARMIIIAALLPPIFHAHGLEAALLVLPLADLVKYLVIGFGAERSGIPTFRRDILTTLAILPLFVGGFWLRSLLLPLIGEYAPWLSAWVVCGLWLVLRRHDAEALLAKLQARATTDSGKSTPSAE
jgi:O-antigen/teichoic acid export membrane protein